MGLTVEFTRKEERGEGKTEGGEIAGGRNGEGGRRILQDLTVWEQRHGKKETGDGIGREEGRKKDKI